MPNPITLPVIIDSLSTRKDGSIKLTMETRELGGADSARLFELRGTEAWILIAADEIKEPIIPETKPDASLNKKTSAQRLRARMYVYYTKELQRNPDEFEYWYDREMDRIGQRYLERVEND